LMNNYKNIPVIFEDRKICFPFAAQTYSNEQD